MLDENTMMEETDINSEDNTEESGGAPVGLLIAGALAGGAMVWKGLTWICGKVFGKKKYTEVQHGGFSKEK